ncbi:aldehyde dehydrogenase family protein [Mesorhizobium atlanticum]
MGSRLGSSPVTSNWRFGRPIASLPAKVYVNDWWVGGVETPFGGTRRSGYGREKGQEALLGSCADQECRDQAVRNRRAFRPVRLRHDGARTTITVAGHAFRFDNTATKKQVTGVRNGKPLA